MITPLFIWFSCNWNSVEQKRKETSKTGEEKTEEIKERAEKIEKAG